MKTKHVAFQCLLVHCIQNKNMDAAPIAVKHYCCCCCCFVVVVAVAAAVVVVATIIRYIFLA